MTNFSPLCLITVFHLPHKPNIRYTQLKFSNLTKCLNDNVIRNRSNKKRVSQIKELRYTRIKLYKSTRHVGYVQCMGNRCKCVSWAHTQTLSCMLLWRCMFLIVWKYCEKLLMVAFRALLCNSSIVNQKPCAMVAGKAIQSERERKREICEYYLDGEALSLTEINESSCYLDNDIRNKVKRWSD